MMNEFGVPMNEAEMSMMPGSPGKHHLERELALSGAKGENFLPVLIGAALGFGGAAAVAGGTALALTAAHIGATVAITAAGAAIGGQYMAGSTAARAARKQAEAQNEYTERSHEYDVELWNMQRDKILADREQAVKVIETKARNENAVADWKDITNIQRYVQEVQIRQREQDSLDAQYEKSNYVYDRQISLNERSANSAMEDEYRSLEEIEAEQRYTQQDTRLKFLEAEGEMRARFASGRGAAKGSQTSYFEMGQKMAAVNAALTGATMNRDSRVQEIARDRESADLAAEANRMLDPGVLPEVPGVIATPRAEFLYPRQVGEYDFGPQPVYGVYHSPSAAAAQVWGNTISGIAGTVAGIATPLIAASDIELKENIEHVGVSPSGLNIYEWNYIDNTRQRYRGVVAQDVLTKVPSAVGEMDNGYLGVDYSQIDVNLTLV